MRLTCYIRGLSHSLTLCPLLCPSFLCVLLQKCEYGSPEDFLSLAVDVPPQQAVCNAVSMLRKIGACQKEGYKLTPLGLHLASLPVDVKIGKMLIYGAILGCLEPVVSSPAGGLMLGKHDTYIKI